MVAFINKTFLRHWFHIRITKSCTVGRRRMIMLKFIKFCIKSHEAQDQQCRHSEIVKAKEELAKKNQEILQHHSLLNETEQLLVC